MSNTLSSPSLHEEVIKRRGYASLFEKHTVLLTGSTGALGAVLLYKLAVQVPTHKIYVLIRGSPDLAIQKWKKAMPVQTQPILHSRLVHFVVGDMTKPDFGVDALVMEELRQQVTLVIHAAAKITLDADLAEAVENNCLPSLELAKMAARFRRLKLFVQVSTAYVSSFLPDGHVAEKLYSVTAEVGGQDEEEDPEKLLGAILRGEGSPFTERFSSNYTYAKYLMERLMLQRFPTLPFLLVRPTIFGPAVRDPYPYYAPENSTPLNRFATLFLATHGGPQVWHAAEGYDSAANTLDEMPVDLVANACLLHAVAGTQGVVHIGSQLYVKTTLDEMMQAAVVYAPEAMRHALPQVLFVKDRTTPQCFLAELVKVGSRNWLFDCGRSFWLKQLGGPLSLTACQHDADKMTRKRARDAWERVLRSVKL
ncbi:NAD-binding domain 4 protein [Aspergillus saccharolyticus JOP 1030-1]|uniref:Fatty acyl-CoA reductase n=1 Tax=Aspergillus saccharolyticus JOP 1030-1 TaxID=1450539 RepID=A0A318ZHM1_9EURO|nr:NAD-binding domain 4 protein [Aspergillus saccharolyticus JOP 1030-1]PYH46989.1 NAD-binding domain 4 protein [Aspergillus saccharolyticus JOP 1030-1]